MTAIVGLDPSLSATGLALPDRVIRFAAPARAEKVKDDPSMQLDLDRFDGLAQRIIGHLPEDAVLFIEAPSLNSVHQAVNMAGCAWIVRDRLTRAGYRYVDVPPSVLKKYATGRGNAGKPEVVAEAIRRLDYAGHDDNEADALWLQQIGSHLSGTPEAVKVPGTHLQAFKKWGPPLWLTPSLTP